MLKPGRYEYRFVVDGQWRDDPTAVRFVTNPFGGLICVVEVKPSTTPPAGQRLKVLDAANSMLIREGRAVCKISSGQPKLDHHETKLSPLGPL